MDPIDPFGGPGFSPANRDEKRVRRKGAHSISFSNIFSAASEESEHPEGATLPGGGEEEAPIESLLDQVHEIGEKVKESPTIAVVQEYKSAVRAFLAYVVKHTLALERRESGSSVLRRKRFTLINVIDQRLERFAAEIVAGQHEQLEILEKIDEINGLLVDLLG